MTETLQAPAAPPRRSSLRTTWFDLVRSLAAVVAIVAGLVLLVPRPQGVEQPAVDVLSAASAATRSLGFDVSVPRGLPATWVPTSAGLQSGADGVRAWVITYRTPSGYAGLRQASRPTDRWESVAVIHGEPGDTETVGGVYWLHRDRPDRGTTSLVRRLDGMTWITSSLGSTKDAAVLAGAVPR